MSVTNRLLSRATAIILAALLAACPLLGCAPSEEPQAEDEGVEPVEIVRSDEAEIESTPRDQWRKGVMPYLYQIDPQWSETEYGGGRFAKQGCGPTALSMVYIYLTGKTDLDPVQMAEFSTESGYATDEQGTSWALMSEGAAQLGLYSETLPAVPSTLQASLEAGHPLICVMAPGTFTEVGHYIVVERMASDGKAVVHDSNSVGRSMRTWDLELICAEAENIWSFSAA